MLGRMSDQGELFRPDHLLREHVGRESIYGFLAEARSESFRDEDFAGLYVDHGRPSVPPSQLAVALILQTLDRVSDEEAINRSAYDIRWKVALGLELEEKLCAKSTLQLFRSKLILHESYGRLFEKSILACQKAGLMKGKKLEVAIDTTPVLGRGAVKDTFNLVSDQIRRIVEAVVELKDWDLGPLVEEHGLSRHFAKSFKGASELDWGDPEEKRALIGQLVADAKVTLAMGRRALNGFALDAERTQKLRERLELLSDLLLQDIDEQPDDGGGPVISQGTSRDRKVSVTDPDMRHGRKSPSESFEGYKATVVAETESGVILETGVQPANAPDSQGAKESIESAAEAAGKPIDRVLGDTAYGGLETRREIESTKVELIAKAPPVPHKKGCFTIDDFKIDRRRGVATCPAGKKSTSRHRSSALKGNRYVFSPDDCRDCPLRSRCTTSSARSISISATTEAQKPHRKRQKTKGFKRAYRRRVIVEHRIGRLMQLGARQAKYMGQKNVAFQIAIAATVANLVAAMAALAALIVFWCVSAGRRPPLFAAERH